MAFKQLLLYELKPRFSNAERRSTSAKSFRRDAHPTGDDVVRMDEFLGLLLADSVGLQSQGVDELITTLNEEFFRFARDTNLRSTVFDHLIYSSSWNAFVIFFPATTITG